MLSLFTMGCTVSRPRYHREKPLHTSLTTAFEMATTNALNTIGTMATSSHTGSGIPSHLWCPFSADFLAATAACLCLKAPARSATPMVPPNIFSRLCLAALSSAFARTHRFKKWIPFSDQKRDCSRSPCTTRSTSRPIFTRLWRPLEAATAILPFKFAATSLHHCFLMARRGSTLLFSGRTMFF